MDVQATRKMTWQGLLTEDSDLCFLLTDTGVCELAPVTCDGDLRLQEFDDLPIAITAPCLVRTRNRVFRMDREGLYRLCMFPEGIQQVILYGGNIHRLVGSIGYLHVHGFRTCQTLATELIALARTTVLSVPCGTISSIAVEIMTDLGLEARPVSVLTMDQWNSYSCGHALYEYRDPTEGRWILADSDLGVLFASSGRLLDADELCGLVRTGGQWELVWVMHRLHVDCCTDELETKPAFYTAISAALADPAQVQVFCERVFQVPQIGSDFTVDTEDERERFVALAATQDLHYNFVPRDEFRARYYGP